MGEYFAWANIDKRERLDMAAFDSGFKMVEPCWVGNGDIDAVCTLLADRWRGDTVAFLGDSSTGYWPDTSPEALAYRTKESPVLLDYAEDTYEDITCLFKQAEGLAHMEFTETEILEIPYEGPFNLEIEHRRYVINHTKKLFYDRKATPIRCVEPHKLGIEDPIVRFDPFPILFAKDSRLAFYSNHENQQFEIDWVGDFVEAVDDEPPQGYLDVSAFYDYWTPSLLVDDATALAAMSTEEYKKLVNSSFGATDALKAVLPEYVLMEDIKEPKYWPPIA